MAAIVVPLSLVGFLFSLVVGFYWGCKHEQRMQQIDEPDEPQIFEDEGLRLEDDALTAEQLASLDDDEVKSHLEDQEDD